MTTETTNVFTPFRKEERRVFLDDYLAHLQRRDGEPDLRTRVFSVREQFFRDLGRDPVRRSGSLVVDPTIFERNELRYQPEAGLDEATLWALAVAKTNRAERDGVEYALARTNPATRTLDNPLTYIEIEEFYHTRILKDALDVLGLDMQYVPPPRMTRFLTHSMFYLPKPIANVAILCSEVVGVAGFRLLADKATELFSDQQKPLQRIDELFQQILVDEVGHVHYARSQLGPARLAVAKRMLPVVARYLMHDIPEFELLFGREKLMTSILKAEVDDSVLGYADRFVPSYGL